VLPPLRIIGIGIGGGGRQRRDVALELANGLHGEPVR